MGNLGLKYLKSCNIRLGLRLDSDRRHRSLFTRVYSFYYGRNLGNQVESPRSRSLEKAKSVLTANQRRGKGVREISTTLRMQGR